MLKAITVNPSSTFVLLWWVMYYCDGLAKHFYTKKKIATKKNLENNWSYTRSWRDCRLHWRVSRFLHGASPRQRCRALPYHAIRKPGSIWKTLMCGIHFSLERFCIQSCRALPWIQSAQVWIKLVLSEIASTSRLIINRYWSSYNFAFQKCVLG